MLNQEKEQYIEIKNKLAKKIRDLEMEVMTSNDKVMESNKTYNILASKNNIKLESVEEDNRFVRMKLEEKERVILSLKNEIALYNEECLSAKRSNEELDYQIQRLTKDLKDIMLNYDA